MEEIWKDVVGYEGRYEVSSFGRIRSVGRYIERKNGIIIYAKSKILKQQIKYGKGTLTRYQVNLYDGSNNKMFLVSRIVAKAFIPNPNNLPQVNHIDEDPSNNHVENLEWCTEHYNMTYGTRIERITKSLQKKINVYDLNNNFITSFESIKEAAKELNCDNSCITKVCKGYEPYHKGYIFKYA